MLQSLSEKSSQDSQPGKVSLVIGPTEVADVMVAKVVTLSTHHGFDEVVRLMNDRHFRHCIVVDIHGKLGWYYFRPGRFAERWRAIPIHEWKSLDQIMTRNPITVKRDTSILDAVSKILSKRINCLPVVDDDGSICGIVTSTDLLKSYQQLLEMVHKQAG